MPLVHVYITMKRSTIFNFNRKSSVFQLGHFPVRKLLVITRGYFMKNHIFKWMTLGPWDIPNYKFTITVYHLYLLVIPPKAASHLQHRPSPQETLPRVGRGLGTVLWDNGRRQRGLVRCDDGHMALAKNTGEMGCGDRKGLGKMYRWHRKTIGTP